MTNCEFYFIARNFISIYFTFFSICFYNAQNIGYQIGSWNLSSTMEVWLKSQFICQKWKLCASVQEQGRFSRIRHFDKHFIYSTRRKVPAGGDFAVFLPRSFYNSILNERIDEHLIHGWTQLGHFFPLLEYFFKFWKKAGEIFPSPPR